MKVAERVFSSDGSRCFIVLNSAPLTNKNLFLASTVVLLSFCMFMPKRNFLIESIVGRLHRKFTIQDLLAGFTNTLCFHESVMTLVRARLGYCMLMVVVCSLWPCSLGF